MRLTGDHGIGFTDGLFELFDVPNRLFVCTFYMPEVMRPFPASSFMT